VDVVVRGDHLVIDVRDDGKGGARFEAGRGLRGLEDRVAALGGSLAVVSPAGGGTWLHAELALLGSAGPEQR
jgi:signal transduction histidine kinase